MQRDLPRALSTFLNGLAKPTNELDTAAPVKTNELDQILIYDIAFCYLMMLNFEKAFFYFNKYPSLLLRSLL